MNYSLDTWVGVTLTETEGDVDSLEAALRIVRLLDASRHTLAMLEGCHGQTLLVGGGSGSYVLVYRNENGEEWNIGVHGEFANESAMLNVGGQEGDYSLRFIHSLSSTELLVSAFFQAAGVLYPDSAWGKV